MEWERLQDEHLSILHNRDPRRSHQIESQWQLDGPNCFAFGGRSHQIESQRFIGWTQLFCVRWNLTMEWARLQDEHLSILRNKDPRYSGQKWISGIIAALWKHWYLCLRSSQNYRD
jgi:hypothetical protein